MPKRTVSEITSTRTPVWNRPKLRVCAYIRVSTGHEKQLDSLENQRQYYERIIQANPDYEYCGIFSDAGISGAKENRPGFNAMLDAARSGNIDLILTKSISRFARNTLLLLEAVRELRALDVGVIFDEQRINTLSPDGELMLTVLASIAEEERHSLSQNVKIAIRNRAKLGDGAIASTILLLGYKKGLNRNVVIDEENAWVIRKIYQLYLDGMTQQQIADYLNDNNCPPYATPGVPWDYHQVRRVLYNEKYAGDCIRLKYYTTDSGKCIKNHGEHPRIYIRDDHPAIIDRIDWDATRVALAKRRIPSYSYSGQLKCPLCGASLRRHSRNYCDYVDWVCGTYLTKGKSTCTGIRVPEEALQKLLVDLPYEYETYVVMEVCDDKNSSKRKTADDYYLVALSEYRRRSEQ